MLYDEAIAGVHGGEESRDGEVGRGRATVMDSEEK